MPSAEHRLGLRTLFIVPSRFGILWLGAALLLLLVGIQTSSNSSLLLISPLGSDVAGDVHHPRQPPRHPAPLRRAQSVICRRAHQLSARDPQSEPKTSNPTSLSGGERHALEQLSDGDTIVPLHWTPLQRGL